MNSGLARLWQRARGWSRAQALETTLLDWSGKRPPGMVNRRLVRVLGMRRTGNHAIMRWIMESIGADTLLLNNVVPGKNGYRHRHIFPEFVTTPAYQQRMRRARFRNFEPLDGLLVSFEDHSVGEFDADGANPRLHDYYGISADRRDVLLLRDPFNLFASRIKSGKVSTKLAAMDQKRLYIDHAEAFLGARTDLVRISFNAWHSDPVYRANIQGQLGLTPHAVDRETVSWQGGGSSFDGRALDGMASSMGVLTRWREMEDDPRFAAMFADGELERYSRAIFGDLRVAA